MWKAPFAVFIAAVMIVGFQNCGQFSAQSVRESVSSLCSQEAITKLRALASLAPVEGVRCDEPSEFRCVQRVFRPGVGHAKTTSLECLDPATCLEVERMNFDTSVAKSTEHDAAAFDEGGEYNHDVFECLHSKARTKGISILVFEGASLREAFEGVKKSCTERSSHAAL